jgi:hypothetical protein
MLAEYISMLRAFVSALFYSYLAVYPSGCDNYIRFYWLGGL